MTIRSKPATDAYRTGWDRTFSSAKPKHHDRFTTPAITEPKRDPATCPHTNLSFTNKPMQQWCEDCGKEWTDAVPE
jgi:hypothetical protein